MATQRQSDKHSPRVDDELAHDTSSLTHGAPVESRSRPDLRQEDPAEDAPATAAEPPGVPAGMSPEEVDMRAELARSLRPSVFPARPAELVRVAEEEAASSVLIGFLRNLPDRRYGVLEEVYEALGEHGETRRA